MDLDARKKRYETVSDLFASGQSMLSICRQTGYERNATQRMVWLTAMPEAIKTAYFDGTMPEAYIAEINKCKHFGDDGMMRRFVCLQGEGSIRYVRLTSEIRTALDECNNPAVRRALQWVLLERGTIGL